MLTRKIINYLIMRKVTFLSVLNYTKYFNRKVDFAGSVNKR